MGAQTRRAAPAPPASLSLLQTPPFFTKRCPIVLGPTQDDGALLLLAEQWHSSLLAGTTAGGKDGGIPQNDVEGVDDAEKGQKKGAVPLGRVAVTRNAARARITSQEEEVKAAGRNGGAATTCTYCGRECGNAGALKNHVSACTAKMAADAGSPEAMDDDVPSDATSDEDDEAVRKKCTVCRLRRMIDPGSGGRCRDCAGTR